MPTLTGDAKQRWLESRCARLRERGLYQPKTDDATYKQIVCLLGMGLIQKHVAKLTGVSVSTVARINQRPVRKEQPGE